MNPDQLPHRLRTELAFALHEARSLLLAAHVMESSVAMLGWDTTPARVRAAVAAARRGGPQLLETMVGVCNRLERLLILTELEEARDPEAAQSSDTSGKG